MQGRWFKIKKSILLRLLAGFLLLVFIALTILSIVVFKIPDLWFFSFCLCIGVLELLESFMFHFDSAFYFGTLLALIGSFGYIFAFLSLRSYAIFFVALAFIMASLLTALRYGQKFHLIIAYSTTFLTIYGFLFVKNLITLPISIAFSGGFLLLLILDIVLYLKGVK